MYQYTTFDHSRSAGDRSILKQLKLFRNLPASCRLSLDSVLFSKKSTLSLKDFFVGTLSWDDGSSFFGVFNEKKGLLGLSMLQTVPLRRPQRIMPLLYYIISTALNKVFRPISTVYNIL